MVRRRCTMVALRQGIARASAIVRGDGEMGAVPMASDSGAHGPNCCNVHYRYIDGAQ